MTLTAHTPVAGTEPRARGPFLVMAAMLVALPLVAIQGPAHTTPMDAVNALFVGLYWCWLLVRREKMLFPLAFGFWLIQLGSCTGIYAADERVRAALTVIEDVYLYVWFVTLVHFLARRCRISDVAMIFILVACGVAFLTVADAHLGLFGGRFAGMKRATGTFENPNMFGDYLVGAFFVTWAAAAAGRRIFYAGLPLLGLGILSTHSNGCLVSLIGGCGVTVIAYPAFWKPKQLGSTLVLAGTLFGIVGAFHDQLQQLAVERFSGSRTEVGGAALKGASERLPIWANILKLVAQKPGGIGPGNLANVEAATTGDKHSAHSEYLGMLAERGFFGLAGWGTVLGGLFLMLGRIRKAAAAGFRPLGVEQLYGLFGALAAHALVIELSHFRHTWIVFAIITATAMQAAARMAAAGERPRLAPLYAEAA